MSVKLSDLKARCRVYLKINEEKKGTIVKFRKANSSTSFKTSLFYNVGTSSNILTFEEAAWDSESSHDY